MPRTTKAYPDPAARLDSDARARKNEQRRILQESRPFVVWDGEGTRGTAPRKPQNYSLFGCYNGVEHHSIVEESLSTLRCLQFIIEMGRANPNAIHVGFAFDYDVNMILRSLSPNQFSYLNKHTFCRVGENYRIEHIPGKWFRVTQYGPLHPVVPSDRETVTIFDTWGFFQASLVSALESTIPQHPLMSHIDAIKAGKKRRDAFTYAEIKDITEYWGIENELFHALINHLRDMLYRVDLRISKWHGPGALASYVYAQQGVKKHKADCGDDVYNASRFAYAGGRFERFHIGRYEDCYGYDINSAYPYAIAQLPSLSEGRWLHNESPTRFVEFGVYRVSMRGPGIARGPSPLFHRDETGNITFPHRLDGWYWSPELRAIQRAIPDARIRIHEGYEYVDWESRPFAFVAEAYEERRRLKELHDGAQIAIKLMLNSLYGKMAQRAGWERTGKAPTWHQLEWAGWVTSYTRSMLFELMAKVPYDQLVAVETDGIYSTATPESIGIGDSRILGEWEVNRYDELIYLQSGLYAKRDGTDWAVKFRGLDKDTVSATSIREHARLLHANAEWPPLVGTTTRFIGYRNALFREAQNRGPMKVHHRVWETTPKDIDCGSVGKRVHSPKLCAACKAGANAYEMPHETVIKSRTALQSQQLESHMHDIPWMDDRKMTQWREYHESQNGLLSA